MTRGQFRVHPQADFNEVNIVSSRDFHLLTLGRLTLQGEEGEPAADALRKQRRKLAVLAVLALARKPIPRDSLLDMFWGEEEESRARHSLSEALSHLRRVLGPHAITARGAEVELEAAVPLRVDARELAEAVAGECWGDAVRLYGGAFLDGVHPGGSTRLEAWIGQHRRELERLFLRACEGEVARLGRAGRWEAAVPVAQRWADADPVSEAATLALMSALEAPGTDEADARALQAYDALRRRLEKEYGTSPAKRAQLRAAVLAERLSKAPATSLEAFAGDPPAVSVLSGATTPGAPDDVAAAPRLRRRGALWLGAGALAVAASIALGFVVKWSRAPPPPAAGSRVAVLPFSVRGPADYGYLREGVVDLLSADLDGAGPFRTVDPEAVLIAALDADGRRADGPAVARKLGAGLFVQGEVVAAGGSLRISAGLF
ncbi:MAG TPA: BTAD domain-containing putative transcriptional regulator, partial [Anaeromyxobacteraceae bacterium]|nr:BTAD domain-containing putative transcriptional regulator [Anaeromyxobacteraceae bacterium]